MEMKLLWLVILSCISCIPTISPAQEAPSKPVQEAEMIIKKLKAVLKLEDAPLHGENSEILFLSSGNSNRFHLVRCRKSKKGWKGTYYSLVRKADKAGNTVLAVDKSRLVPDIGWAAVETKLRQNGITELPTQDEYESELQKPDDKGQYFHIIDGTQTCMEVNTEGRQQYRCYSNIKRHSEARPGSPLLQKLNKIAGVFYQDLLPKL